MSSRIQKLGVAVGKKGVGKTYTTNKEIYQYLIGNPSKGVPGRRVLILDVNDEFENVKSIPLEYIQAFSVHPNIEARRIRPFHSNGIPMSLDEVANALFYTLHNFKGGMLLIEDVNKYISDNMPNDLIGAICTNRHSNLDIMLHYQSIGRINPKVWQNVNYIRFHKNTDSVEKHKNKFEDKYEMLTLCENIVNRQYITNPRFYTYVDIDEEKIRGNITMEMVNKSIDDYIQSNYSKLISPLLKQVDLSKPKNTKNYTQSEAIKSVKERLLQSYFL